MTQREVLDLLDSIMPDIISSGNPEASMLKCAKANNLSVAQLEKLGHVFNTMKTNVALTKMASRGDSFTIVDVPGMVSSYTTFDPNKELSAKNKAVHKKVDKITKFARGNKLPTFEDMFTSKDALMSNGDVQFELDNDDWQEVQGRKPTYDIMHKSASAESSAMSWEDYDKYKAYTKSAEEGFRQVAFDADQDIKDICKEMFHKFAFKADKWHEAVEDTFFTHGESAATAIAAVEDYMAENGLKFSVADMTKVAGLPGLVEDRHGVVDAIENMMYLAEVRDAAVSELEKMASKSGSNLPAPPQRKNTSNSKSNPRPVLNSTKDLVDALKAHAGDKSKKESLLPEWQLKVPMPTVLSAVEKLPEKGVELTVALDKLVGGDTQEAVKYLEKGKDKSKRQMALEMLVLNDPVISSADQSQVKSIYDTLVSISPTFAADPNLLGPAIKEALQYGAVPVQMVTNLVKAEESLANTAAKKQLAEKKEGLTYADVSW
jgi:hypothetical protein